ncbi:MAG: dimethyl sulfoxide reductase anchor subunit [Acidobacteria bacterium]|nr:dimethyl sulfoxide reductase anchor subunit [Acidobacteriota bacterium]
MSNHAPLVWFTSLAIGGAGIIAAAAWHMRTDLPSQAVALAAGAVALGAALIVSTLHLGRKTRAPLVARGVGRSELSREVLLAGATLGASIALLVMHWQGHPVAWLKFAAAATAVLFLLSIGLVYRLGGQRTWHGATVLLPLTTGLVCGEVFLLAIGSAALRGISVAMWAIAADAAVFVVRRWSLARSAFPLTEQGTDANRFLKLSDARPFLFNVLPSLFLIWHAAGFALLAVAMGLVLDRWAFYALADQHTTEAEIARVEDVIERGSRFG